MTSFSEGNMRYTSQVKRRFARRSPISKKQHFMTQDYR